MKTNHDKVKICHCGDEMGKGACLSAPHVACKEREEHEPPEYVSENTPNPVKVRYEDAFLFCAIGFIFLFSVAIVFRFIVFLVK